MSGFDPEDHYTPPPPDLGSKDSVRLWRHMNHVGERLGQRLERNENDVDALKGSVRLIHGLDGKNGQIGTMREQIASINGRLDKARNLAITIIVVIIGLVGTVFAQWMDMRESLVRIETVQKSLIPSAPRPVFLPSSTPDE